MAEALREFRPEIVLLCGLAAGDGFRLELRARRPDLCYFAGDLALFGARPEACSARLRAAPWVIPLHGNTDRMILEAPEIPEDADEPTRARYATIRETARCGPWRSMREEGLYLLYALSKLGDLEQRRQARDLLETKNELEAEGIPSPPGSRARSNRGFYRWYLDAIQLLESQVAEVDA